MKSLSAQEILILHALVIDETGGLDGVRDVNLLKAVADKPQASFGGSHLYTTVFQRAAILLEGLTNYHVFVDGNKRTAMIVAARFLFLNGYELTATNSDLVSCAIAVATKEVDIVGLAAWVKDNSRPL